MTDEKLMELYQSGDYMAFEVLFNRHKSTIYSYLHKRVENKSLIGDLFQEIFIKFHKSRDRYSSDYPLLAWMYTISRSVLLDHYKKAKHSFVELSEHIPASQTDSQELPINIQHEKSLTENEKNAITLRYISDQEFDEISKTLKTSPVNVRKLISRGLQKLRLKYAKDQS